MTDPIGPSQSAPLQTSASQSPNVPLMCKQMQSGAMTLADHLQKVVEEPSLSAQVAFLKEFTANGHELNQTIEQTNQLR